MLAPIHCRVGITFERLLFGERGPDGVVAQVRRARRRGGLAERARRAAAAPRAAARRAAALAARGRRRPAH